MADDAQQAVDAFWSVAERLADKASTCDPGMHGAPGYICTCPDPADYLGQAAAVIARLRAAEEMR